jgi:predicted transcriptional regulator
MSVNYSQVYGLLDCLKHATTWDHNKLAYKAGLRMDQYWTCLELLQKEGAVEKVYDGKKTVYKLIV